MTTLSVVIPAYDEESGIADIANRVLAVRPSLVEIGVCELELLVVDDGSADKTALLPYFGKSLLFPGTFS